MANKQKMKYTKEELNAMRINAMLQGIDPSTITNEPIEDTEDFEIEIVDEEKPKKKKKAKSKSLPIGSENQTFTTTQQFIEEREEFKGLRTSIDFNITYNEHDIHYKEQYWGIPERTVKYSIELVKIPKVAKDISDLMNNNSPVERDKAEKGLVRYYKVVTYENVVHKIKEVGYIKVVNNKGKFAGTVKVLGNILKSSNANPEKVTKNLMKVLNDIILK